MREFVRKLSPTATPSGMTGPDPHDPQPYAARARLSGRADLLLLPALRQVDTVDTLSTSSNKPKLAGLLALWLFSPGAGRRREQKIGLRTWGLAAPGCATGDRRLQRAAANLAGRRSVGKRRPCGGPGGGSLARLFGDVRDVGAGESLFQGRGRHGDGTAQREVIA